MQDTDGGFYFLVYPQNREYEANVTPDHGDPQVVWPKTTSVTAASVAALAQCASSPAFKRAYPAAAAAYLAKAKLGWQFLMNAIANTARMALTRRSLTTAITSPTGRTGLGRVRNVSRHRRSIHPSSCSPGSILPTSWGNSVTGAAGRSSRRPASTCVVTGSRIPHTRCRSPANHARRRASAR